MSTEKQKRLSPTQAFFMGGLIGIAALLSGLGLFVLPWYEEKYEEHFDRRETELVNKWEASMNLHGECGEELRELVRLHAAAEKDSGIILGEPLSDSVWAVAEKLDPKPPPNPE